MTCCDGSVYVNTAGNDPVIFVVFWLKGNLVFRVGYEALAKFKAGLQG